MFSRPYCIIVKEEYGFVGGELVVKIGAVLRIELILIVSGTKPTRLGSSMKGFDISQKVC